MFNSAFDFYLETLTLHYKTGIKGGKSLIIISELWKSFGQQLMFITGENALKITNEKNSSIIILENLQENTTVKLLLW